ncbi:MurR/RpiR family transcriptional regulator, partial [Escherichia coli]|nr:MurR/RpiR family transcriptional regulator [Escherichia coli]
MLVMSAMELARTLGTSDATVIRTAKALGFDGLDALRRAIADDLKTQDNPAERITQTIRETGGDLKK